MLTAIVIIYSLSYLLVATQFAYWLVESGKRSKMRACALALVWPLYCLWWLAKIP